MSPWGGFTLPALTEKELATLKPGDLIPMPPGAPVHAVFVDGVFVAAYVDPYDAKHHAQREAERLKVGVEVKPARIRHDP